MDGCTAEDVAQMSRMKLFEAGWHGWHGMALWQGSMRFFGLWEGGKDGGIYDPLTYSLTT